MKRRMRGFTLVEISVLLLALAIILPGAVIFWQLYERQHISAVQMDARQQSRAALLGYLHAHYRLPCPATDTTGLESCTDGGGLRQVGYLPWRTLDLPRPEAGALRYGVYREPSATPQDDRDLAAALDRMNPLRVATPNPPPQNADGPNPFEPPIPVPVAVQLGATQSGDDAAPLNTACDASKSPPCPPGGAGGAGAANLIDICLALNTASETLVAPAGRLATKMRGARRSVAFVLAAPGLLDADGDGSAFDGANATASDADPTFEGPGTPVTSNYDDAVTAASHSELFTELHCAAALSAVSHAHFNAATGAFVMERALYDYRDQLFVAVKLAESNVAAATAGVAGAAGSVAGAARELISAIGDTTMSAGARSFQIGLAAAGIVAAGISTGLAAFALEDASASLQQAQQVHSDFAARTTAMTQLATSINVNTLKADAIGY